MKVIYSGSKNCHHFFLHKINAKVLCFTWRVTYAGEFLAVIQSLKYIICRRMFAEDVCLNLGNGTFSEQEKEVYSIFTMWHTATMLAWMLPALVTLPLIGMYLGRLKLKQAFIILTALQALSSVFYLLNVIYPQMYVSGYMVSALLHALYGFGSGFRLISYSYVAQVAVDYSAEKRSREMIMLTTLRSLAGISAPYLLGTILDKYGFITGYAVTLSIDIISFLYAVILLPDPQTDPTCKSPLDGDQGTPSSVKESLKHLLSPILKFPKLLLPIAVVFSILEGLTVSLFNFLPIYLTHSPINYSSQDLGAYMTIQSIFPLVGTLFISCVYIKMVGENDKEIILGCILGRIFMITVYIFARSDILLFVALTGEVINYAYNGAAFSYASRVVPGANFSSIFTCMTQLSLVSTIVMFPLVNWIYRTTVTWYPQFVFVFLDVIALIGLIIWSVYMWKTKDYKTIQEKKSGKPETCLEVNGELLSCNRKETNETMETFV